MDNVKDIVSRAWNAGMTYSDFSELTKELAASGKTTGDDQSQDRVEYTKLNDVRAKRVIKTMNLLPDTLSSLKDLKRHVGIIAVTESWCGDGPQLVPVINQIASHSEKMELKVVLRDENPELIDSFLTNGGRAIPVFILFDRATGEILGHWGPRPQVLQDRAMKRRDDPNPEPYEEFSKAAQLWYAKDKTHSVQREFMAFMTAKVAQ